MSETANKRSQKRPGPEQRSRQTPSSHSPSFWAQCHKKSASVGEGEVRVFETPSSPAQLASVLGERIKDHYIEEAILRKWGRGKIAELLKHQVPAHKRGRSGDLGEILATEFVNSDETPFEVPIHRLRWKDHRDMPLRGEDILAFQFDQRPVKFLKGEAKSWKRLDATVVSEARRALEANAGLPLAHTLGFVMQKLYAANKDTKASAIEEYTLGRLPSPSQVSHMIFTFSENDPTALLTTDSKLARRPIMHLAVGIKASDHQGLINAVFSLALDG